MRHHYPACREVPRLPELRGDDRMLMRKIETVSLEITSHCSMRCPDCTCGIPDKKSVEREHHSWEYFENAARYFYGVERIHCTGGEPTVHPQFPEFAAKFKQLFGCKLLTVETNGYGARKFPEVFRLFDQVYFSVYTEASFPGCPNNQDALQKLSALGLKQLIVGKIDFTPRTRRGTKMCDRGLLGVAYARGLLYPCCVGPGLPEHGIPLTENWREEISRCHPPCDQCWFAL